MQALILATDETPPGGAAKLHPLTEQTPAPLLPVLNRPVMAYPLELLVRAGLRDIGVAVYHQAGCIEAHFATGTSSAARLTYFLQREPLGSAGSVRWAAAQGRTAAGAPAAASEAAAGALVVLPGDALIDFDVCAALDFHKAHGGIATVIGHAPQGGAAAQRGLAVAADGRVTGLPEADAVRPDAAGPAGRLLSDTAAYIFDPRALDCIPPRRVFDSYADLLPALLAYGPVYAFEAGGYWNPLDTVQAYQQAQLDALASALAASQKTGAADGAEQRRVPYMPVREREAAPGIIVAQHVTVHPSARLVAPVYIGAGSQVERDVELGPNAVLGPNTILDEGATVRDSTVLEGTYVGRLVKVEQRVVRGGLVTDARTGDSLRVVDPFLLGEVSPRLIAGLLARTADVIAALVLLLLALPVLAVVALALLLASWAGQTGPVFEQRPRVRWRAASLGEGDAPERQTYGVPHFRTRRADGRPTPLGAWLERLELDHLPALLSVLRGDLRLVGVKPLTPADADRLTQEWQRLPYVAGDAPAAGLTGLWYLALPQAAGGDLDEIVATDAYYTATRSLAGDLYVLASTPAAWVRRVRAVGTPRPVGDVAPRVRQPQWARRARRTDAPLRHLAPAAKDGQD